MIKTGYLLTMSILLSISLIAQTNKTVVKYLNKQNQEIEAAEFYIVAQSSDELINVRRSGSDTLLYYLSNERLIAGSFNKDELSRLNDMVHIAAKPIFIRYIPNIDRVYSHLWQDKDKLVQFEKQTKSAFIDATKSRYYTFLKHKADNFNDIAKWFKWKYDENSVIKNLLDTAEDSYSNLLVNRKGKYIIIHGEVDMDTILKFYNKL